MIHLAGTNPVEQALEELDVFEAEGLDGAIIENYHGSPKQVAITLERAQAKKRNIVLGLNILPNEFGLAFELAGKHNAKFIQLDYVAGMYSDAQSIDLASYNSFRKRYSQVVVLGGVHPKCYTPVEGSDLGKDLKEGRDRADAVVVTGAGTGLETPLEKIQLFRDYVGTHPLIVGAGLNPRNVYQQICIADGGIVGSCLKKGNNTHNSLDIQKIRDFMSEVKKARTV